MGGRSFTPEEDALLLAVRRPNFKRLAVVMGRRPDTLYNRRNLLRARAAGFPSRRSVAVPKTPAVRTPAFARPAFFEYEGDPADMARARR
jgi:hypothetical protein